MLTSIELFIFASIHVGILALVVGTGLGVRTAWTHRRHITASLCAGHCAAWTVTYAGVLHMTLTGNLL